MITREAAQQCRVRDANEVIALSNSALVDSAVRLAVRCECGDAACLACLMLTDTEYEAVRAYGSHFAVGVNHENPESACLLSENEHFGVIDVVSGEDRYQVRARNPRHFWGDGASG